jgi:hypothetical protein
VGAGRPRVLPHIRRGLAVAPCREDVRRRRRTAHDAARSRPTKRAQFRRRGLSHPRRRRKESAIPSDRRGGAHGGALLGWLTASGGSTTARAGDRAAAQPPAAPTGTPLPKPDPEFKGKIAETFEDSTPSHPPPLRAPKGAPNVLVILLDELFERIDRPEDVDWPRAERLVREGLADLPAPAEGAG